MSPFHFKSILTAGPQRSTIAMTKRPGGREIFFRTLSIRFTNSFFTPTGDKIYSGSSLVPMLVVFSLWVHLRAKSSSISLTNLNIGSPTDVCHTL